jgi:eukaryotic-like serine/threonine-protein kinase
MSDEHNDIQIEGQDSRSHETDSTAGNTSSDNRPINSATSNSIDSEGPPTPRLSVIKPKTSKTTQSQAPVQSPQSTETLEAPVSIVKVEPPQAPESPKFQDIEPFVDSGISPSDASNTAGTATPSPASKVQSGQDKFVNSTAPSNGVPTEAINPVEPASVQPFPATATQPELSSPNKIGDFPEEEPSLQLGTTSKSELPAVQTAPQLATADTKSPTPVEPAPKSTSVEVPDMIKSAWAPADPILNEITNEKPKLVDTPSVIPPQSNSNISPIDDEDEWKLADDDPAPVSQNLLSSPVTQIETEVTRSSLLGQTLFDTYAVLDLIGEGTLNFVYSAMKLDSDNESIVALKTPKVVTPIASESFSAAVIQHGKLKHQHIVRSLAYLESLNGQPIYVMEHTQGVPLEDVLQSVEKLDDEDAIAVILLQAATALEYAHSQGVVHGQITPQNILLLDENEQLKVKIADFQIAAISNTASDTTIQNRIGPYLSPEVLNGGSPSQQSDVYSMAVIAYRMVTGHFPFADFRRRDPELLSEPLAKFGPDLKQVHHLNEIVQESLQYEAEYRVDSISDFKNEVQNWINSVHEELASEPDYTVDIEIPTLLDNQNLPPDRPLAQEPAAVSATESKIAPSKAPPTTPKEEQVELVSDTAPAKRRSRRSNKRTGQQNIRSTISELLVLKEKQSKQSENAVMKFTEKIAAEGPRLSPAATISRLVATIVVLGGITIFCVAFIITNPERVRQCYTDASVQLSRLLPRKETKIEKTVVKVPDIARTNIKSARPKLDTRNIHANTPEWAVQHEAGYVAPDQSNPFGNNSSNKPRGNRVRIEYRDYKPK